MQPAELGRYRITGIIGRGGMGVVYEGHDPQIDRAVAIKTIALDALSDHERAMFEGRFRAEMRSAGRLQHHNIAALYDTGRDGGTAYIVMERVAGHDLKRRLAAGERFSLVQVLDIAQQLLAALEFAHRHQVIHRDVKPANVMLQPDGTVKLCDFGVARLADSDATRTQGFIVGSLRYASPEQISGRPIDARTDVFSAGVLLFELLTGELPFQGSTDVEVLHRIAHERAPSLRSIDPSIPADVDAAVQRALAKDPQDRFASAAEFARALGASTGGASVAAMETLPALPAALAPNLPAVATSPSAAASPTAPPASAVRGSAGRVRWVAGAGGALLLLAGVGGWWATRPPAGTRSAVAPASAPLKAGTEASATAPAATPQAPALAPMVASAPPAPAPPPARTTAPTPPAAKPAPPPAAPKATPRPEPGAWRAQFSCGSSRTPGASGPGTEAFSAEVPVSVEGSRITWKRESSTFSEAVAGEFDAQGRFVAEGRGARKNSSVTWQVRARGEYHPESKRIESQVQLVRPEDRFVFRDCKLVAVAGRTAPGPSAPAAAGTPPSPAPAPPQAAAPAAPATTASVDVEGFWNARLMCGQIQNPPPTVTVNRGFDHKASLEVKGRRVVWTRAGATYYESGTGTIDAAGRLKVSGRGWDLRGTEQRNPWQLLMEGEVRAREGRISGQAQIHRERDGTLSRECTMTASR